MSPSSLESQPEQVEPPYGSERSGNNRVVEERHPHLQPYHRRDQERGDVIAG